MGPGIFFLSGVTFVEVLQQVYVMFGGLGGRVASTSTSGHGPGGTWEQYSILFDVY